MLKAPKFWSKKGILSKILVPFSWIYIYISQRRHNRENAAKLSVPVICVGNLVMGGAGKTPMVIALVQILQGMGYKPHIISRGYGAIVHGVKRVDPQKHNYLNVGDEPLLLAKFAPTWVSTNRVKAARAAIENDADVIVMDDGFQNNSIVKDISLIVVDAIQGFGNQYVFPAGPLREPFLNGLNKADATIVIGDGELSYLKSSKKIFHAKFVEKEPLKKQAESVIAFAGLGYPKKFKQSLQKAGFNILEFHAYPDHHPYTITEIEKLIKRAQALKSTLITTSKDAVRLPQRYKNKVAVFKVNLEILEKEELQQFLFDKMKA
jgi:tetraacyldisaccharide 4'-kinase